MAESEETDLGHHVSNEDSDSDSSFEVIEDPRNPRVSTGWTTNFASNTQPRDELSCGWAWVFEFFFWTRNLKILLYLSNSFSIFFSYTF